MPLAAPIGSGLGIQNATNLRILRERITEVPMIVDAGVGTASDAAIAMELGADGMLDEHGDCRGAGFGVDGRSDAGRDNRGTEEFSGRPHAETFVCHGVQSAFRRGALGRGLGELAGKKTRLAIAAGDYVDGAGLADSGGRISV